MYNTLGPEVVKYIINFADIPVAFYENLNILLGFLFVLPLVRLIVVVGGIEKVIRSLPFTTRVQLTYYSKLETAK
jgi:hypothetical protein